MLSTWGRLMARRKKWVLLAALLFTALAGALGGGVADRLGAGGYTDSDSASARASAVIGERFATGEANLVLLVETEAGVDRPEAVAAGTALTEALADEEHLAYAESYWSLDRAAALRSDDGTEALVLARIDGDETRAQERVGALADRYEGDRDGLRVRVGGEAQVAVETNEQTQRDLLRAELIIAPVVMVILVLVFRGLVAAALPLAIAAVAVPGTTLILYLLTLVTDVSFLAMNVTIGLGLGLSIDYSLFVVSRYREELARGLPVPDALGAALATAGRTVAFSALTVMLSLAGLLVFPLYFLRSFAYAGMAVTLFAAAAALVVLPALLALVGHRIDALPVLRRRAPVAAAGPGFWHRLATLVMRRPIPLATGVIALLLLLGSPFLRIEFSQADDRVLPESAEAHQVSEAVRQDFPTREAESLSAVAHQPTTGPDADPEALADYAARLSTAPHVSRVDALTGSYVDGSRIAEPADAGARHVADDGSASLVHVVPEVGPFTDEAREMVAAVRATEAAFPVDVTGPAAEFRDTMDALGDALPLALGLVAAATFVLLFLFTGGLLLPLKALVLNALSLTATFGAMVWVFQEGHLSWLVGDFILTGGIVAPVPVLVLCIAFGLSMDYEVFLLSRIKEEYDRDGDNTRAVAVGLERTGRLVTAAAALVAVVFVAFLSSGITYVKLLGLGLALAVLVDATLIRGVLVPAFMRVAGRANWWAPGPLRRLHARIGLAEAGRAGDGGPGPAAPPHPVPPPPPVRSERAP
ncbi:putative drug exporter of the RND superfamily [Streptomyces zhaozhouensis]|uniref:Putative drug exporter of the RND superfamily n=1 Tax=Streptomyces zhaozhouensis TaxID=1300267 RepID=A0A286E0R6_9ACTN|nr:MMPL family transporter [Streptomyces zhaozhouensis]SOD64497.1 putative drug exporter of the RND superfamily [Streptomyces zhaozhouensis]